MDFDWPSNNGSPPPLKKVIGSIRCLPLCTTLVDDTLLPGMLRGILASWVPPGMVRTIAARFQNLASLNLYNCHDVSDVGVQSIGAGGLSLTSLTLEKCQLVGDVRVQAIGPGGLSLISLNL